METYVGQFNGNALKIEIVPMTQAIYETDIFNLLPWPHSEFMEAALPDADHRFVSLWNGRFANFGQRDKLRPRAELGFVPVS